MLTARLRRTLPWVALGITNVLVLSDVGGPRAAIGLPVALILPGSLALRAMGVVRRGWEWLLHAVALSLAVLMFGGLPLSLIGGPALSPIGCLIALDVLILLLAVAARRVRGPSAVPLQWRAHPAAVAVVFGAAAVAFAVAGAHRLNAGGGPVLTETAVGLVAVTLLSAAMAARRGSTGIAATALYLAGLAVLFATSLRGIGVTGHDIKVEYRVLADVLRHDQWRPGGAFSSYNSCLSLTVLPAFLSRLLGMPALDVFRVVFQAVFALVPVAVFLFSRRLLPAGYAALAAGLFVAFPTFVNDMPKLNRQEIAMVFFAVAALNLRRTGASSRRQIALPVVLAAGMTVSHYTTSYVAVALMAGAWLIRQVRRRLIAPGPAVGWGRPALVLGAMAVLWAAVTGSGTGLVLTFRHAAHAVLAGSQVQSDVNRYALFTAGRPATDDEVLAWYFGVVYSHQTGGLPVLRPECRAETLRPETIPATVAGTTMAGLGVAPGPFNELLRRVVASGLFQAGALAGCALLWWWLFRSRRPRPVTGAHAELAAASLLLLAVMLAVPQLGDSYGTQRLYLQVLILVAPLILFALTRRVVRPAAYVVVLGSLVTMAGLVPQLTGGFSPQLNLNNAGPAYQAEYTTGTDVATMTWIRSALPPNSWVVSDGRGIADLRAMTALFPEEGYTPDMTPAGAYLFLPDVRGDQVTAVVVAVDRVLSYTFPLHCVTAGGRPLVFASGTSRLYGPAVQS